MICGIGALAGLGWHGVNQGIRQGKLQGSERVTVTEEVENKSIEVIERRLQVTPVFNRGV